MLLFLAFALIGVLWLHLRGLNEDIQSLRETAGEHRERLRKLQSEVNLLQRQATSVEEPSVEAEPLSVNTVSSPKQDTAQRFTPPPIPDSPVLQQPLPQWEPIHFESEPVSESFIETPSFLDRVTASGGWEELIGGNVLNKIGALLLVIGIALFLSYSFAHMGPVGIASTAIALTTATLAAGIVLERRDRYRLFSRGLTAAGWAGLYFTAYAIYNLRAAKVIENPVAGTILMLLVAAGMVAHSLRYRVQSLTSLAYGCAFAALALSDQNALVAFALIPLAASMMFLARRLSWYGMSLFGAAAVYTTFLMRPNSGAALVTVQSLLLIFWTMFEVFDLLRIGSKAKERPVPGALFAINALAGVGASAAVWYRLAPDSMWQFCSAVAVLYLASTWFRFAMPGRTHYELSLTISASFVALAIFAGVPGLWISLGIIAEAEVLFLVGRSLNLRFLRMLSLVAFAAAAAQIQSSSGAGAWLIWGVSVDTWAPPLVVMALMFYLNRCLSKQSEYFGFLASAFFALVIGAELPWRYAGVVVMVYGLGLMEVGTRRDLLDFRLQGYGLTAMGAIGAALGFLDPLHVRHSWVYALGAMLSLGVAIRARLSLKSVPELERRGMRIGGAIGAAVLLAVLATRLVSDSYWGIAIVGASIILFELAFRDLPSELLIPALIVNAAGAMLVVLDHTGGVRKFPEQPVWIAYVGAGLAYYFLSARLSYNTNLDRKSIGIIAPWLGSGFALVSIWMLLPDAYVPASAGALAILMAEIGFAARAGNMVWHGRVVSLVAAMSLLGLTSQPDKVIVANCAGVAAMQLIHLFRSRRLPLASSHGYLAALIVAGTLFDQVSGGMLTIGWSLEGAGFLALGFATRERTLRLSGLAMLLICIGKVFFYDLQYLDTLYRVLSFAGLGAILLAVSWIYARFKEQLRRYL